MRWHIRRRVLSARHEARIVSVRSAEVPAPAPRLQVSVGVEPQRGVRAVELWEYVDAPDIDAVDFSVTELLEMRVLDKFHQTNLFALRS